MSGGVKKLAQVAIGAAVGFAQGGPWGAAVGAGLAFYASEQQEKLNTKSPLRDNEPSAQTVRSSKAPVRFILGRVATGGVLVWAQEQAGGQSNGEWLHLVYVLSEGAVDALENIYLGEEEIGSFGQFASYELSVNPTQVNAFLRANCPDWKDNQIGSGLSFVRVSLRYNAEKFPSGIPDTRFVVRGRNDIYDPRTGATGYSANTALHILWYLRARCGVPDDEIVFDTFASAANVCDETVTNADGSVSQRYRTACVIGADEQRTGVLQKLEAACSGKLIRVGGRWMLQAGAYYGPYDFEVTEDMMVGTISGSTEPANDAAINTVRGTFIDPTQSWTETDYPEVSISEWITEDGGEAAETLTFSYVTDPYQAQRLANIELRRRRAGGTISLPMNFSGYNCRPGRVIRVNLPSLNILGEFIVTNWSMGDNEGCTAQVAQYEAAIFDDAVGQPYNPIGFINLPSGGLGSPTALKWVAGDTAEVVQGVLSWLAPIGIVSEYAVIVRQGSGAVQAHTIPASSTQCNISGLLSGSYTMSVAAIGPIARSGEATISVSVNGPPIPEACVVQSSIDSITLIPSNTQKGLNGGTYEYFFSTVPQSAPADATYIGQGLTFTHTGLGFYTNYYYFVRSSNAYGKSAFLYVPASTSNDVGAYLDALAGQIGETQLGKDLGERIDLIDGPPTLPGSVSNQLNELGEQIGAVTDHLQELVDEGQAALAEAQATLTEAQAALQQKIDQVSTIAKSGEYQKEKAYAVGASTRLNDRLYQAKIAVPVDASGAKSPPNATYWVDVGQVVSDSNGLAARVNITETKITNIEGVNTAQGTSINGLQSSLTVTNGNVTAAQNAAQAASDLAGGKGKVITQSAAPAAADRLAQNLWIDTTGNANTPKRWSGSAWVAVTDKVATDAAAAAANALSVANTKADASVVNSLTTRVTAAEGTISSQGTSITGLNNSLTTTNNNVTAAQNAANTANTLAGGKGKVLVQTAAPAAADQLVQNLWIDITGSANTPKRWNGSAWVAVSDKVATDAAAAAANALTVANTKADASAVSSLTTRVTAAEGTISSQGTSITGLNNSLTTTNNNVTAAQNAANTANTLAGGKGKVLVQTAAPAAADQLVQNLWIDITGSANTPKRWNGSAWVAVSDKVATDAAAAAASALTQVATKAEAATVQALSNTVTQQDSTITAQGTEITSIKAAVSNVAGENLLLDPAFATSNGITSNPSAVVLPRNDAAVPAGSSTARVVKLPAPTSTGNSYWGFTSGLAVRPPENGNASQIAVSAGEVYDFELYAYSSVARQHGLWIQFYSAAGASIGHNWANASGDGVRLTSAVGAWTKLTGMATVPADCIRMVMTFRMSSGDATDAFICAPVARKRTGQDSAQATATQSLDGRVTQTEQGLTSQGSQLTQLTNTVAGKADNSALQSLTSTVSQQGDTLTSQGTAVTQLQSTVGAIGGNGTNLLPAEYCSFADTLPALYKGGAVTLSTEVDAGAYSGSFLKIVSAASGSSHVYMASAAADYNLRIAPGVKYIVSFTAKADVAKSVRVRVRAPNAGGTAIETTLADVPVAAGAGRYSFVATMPAAVVDRGLLIFFAPYPAAAGSTWIDAVMIERQIGNSITPSEFSPGASSKQTFAQATAISSLDTRVTETEGVITAQASKLDGIYVQVNPVLAGEATGFAGSTGSLVGVWSELSARIEDGVAQGLRTDIVQAQMDDANRELGKTSATVQETSSALASLDGKVSATWSVKLQVNSQGQYVAAGVGLGIENTPAGLQSQFLVSADRFAVVNNINGILSSPFVVNQGQVFIRDAFIANGSITMLKIGDTLQSDNFVAGIQGWRLLKSGQFEINGHVPGQGTMVMTNRSLRVYDGNNVKRVQLGDLSE